MSASLHLLERIGADHARCRPLRSRCKSLHCRIPRVVKPPSRRGVSSRATESGESSEASFQTQLLSATKRVQALEAYRELLTQKPGDIDLFRAALLIAKHRHPLLDEDKCQHDIDDQVKAVQASLPKAHDQKGFELSYITRQLGEVAGFKGNEKDYYDPDNSCINMVLERQTGIPITLGVLYMAVAQRLGLKMHGLQLPGHFMVGNSVEGTTNLIVDPFTGFKLCSPAEVDEMFKQQYGSMFSAAAPLAPLLRRGELVMGTPDVLVRMLLNLKNIYTGLRQADKVLQITEYLRATRDQSEDLRDAGLCLFSVQRYTDSAELLQQYLALTPHAQDKLQVESVLNRIYQLLQKPNL